MIGMTGYEIEISSKNVVLNLRDTSINDATRKPYTASEWNKENGVQHVLRRFGWRTNRNGKSEYVGRQA
ncbi:MAG: hypothetical protein WCA15_22975 [Candidatus Acidiferrales bacterium]